MKKVSMKIAMAALMIAVGTLGLQAQNGRGTGTCGTGTCVNTSLLTAEQQAILDELCGIFQADMAILRADLQATTNLADKLAIRMEMTTLRDAHLAEVKALLASWGITSVIGVNKGVTGSGTACLSGTGTGICTGTGVGNTKGKGKGK
jgi:hypothetical protein